MCPELEAGVDGTDTANRIGEGLFQLLQLGNLANKF